MWKSLILSVLSAWATSSAVQAMPSDSGIEKIIGGETADIGKYPYFVQGPGCAGALVAPDIVLWAAHCGDIFFNSELIIGAYRDFSTDEGAQVRFCDTWIFDDRYQTGCAPGKAVDINWDYSLCKLDKPVTNLANPNNISIVLNFDDNVPVEDDPLLVMGFGDTNAGPAFTKPLFIEDVEVPYVTNKECNQKKRYDGRVTEQMLCAGFTDVGGKDACQGDSGGPIVKRTTTKEGNIVDVHLGIVSWGFGCAEPLFPGVYSRTSKGIDWIVDKTCNELNSEADYCTAPPKPEDPCFGEELVVTTETDGFAQETTWTVTDDVTGELFKFRKHLVSNNEYEHAPICLPYDGCYKFTINDTFGDGFCLGVGGACSGFYKGELNGEEVFSVINPNFGSSDTQTFCTGSAPTPPTDPVTPTCVDSNAKCQSKLVGQPENVISSRCNVVTKLGIVSDICQATCATVGLGPCA